MPLEQYDVKRYKVLHMQSKKGNSRLQRPLSDPGKLLPIVHYEQMAVVERYSPKLVREYHGVWVVFSYFMCLFFSKHQAGEKFLPNMYGIAFLLRLGMYKCF